MLLAQDRHWLEFFADVRTLVGFAFVYPAYWGTPNHNAHRLYGTANER